MAVCEQRTTNIYPNTGNTSINDLSSEPGTDTSSEGSATAMIIDADRTTKKKISPTKGIRRSTRLSKGRGDLSGHSSDESDPHIDVGDVLTRNGEKLLSSETGIKKRQLIGNQMLAVALVKSVVESKNKVEAQVKEEPVGQNRQAVMTQSTNSISHSKNAANTNTNTSNKFKSTGDGVPILMNASDGTSSVGSGLPSGKVHPLPAPLSARLAPPPVAVTKANVNVSNSTIQRAAKPAPTRANTRSRTRGAKFKNVGLKAEYASVREAPRYAPKPTLPVPNPILSTPISTSQKPSSTKPASKQNLSQARLMNKTQNAHAPVKRGPARTKVVRVKKETSVAALPTSQLPTNTLSMAIEKTENQPLVPTTAMNETKSNEIATTDTDPFPARRRIFSIDLDPEGFDFDLSIGVTGEYTDNAAELPPISSASYNVGGTRKPSDASAPSDIPPYRGRGMSFELFSFSTSLDTSSDLKSEALNGGRPRGDSIIFDPISFSDGGIHEETALQKIRRNSIDLDENEELKLLNTGGFVDAPVTQKQTRQPSASLPQKSSHPANRRGINVASNIPNPVSINPNSVKYSGRAKSTTGRQTKAPSRIPSYHHKSHAKSKHHLTIVGGVSSAKEDTLHMPQGSAAAAAAAASLSSQILQSTMNGTISHTSCPMELLNKGGRIGIYLPEARKERIAKFHSKRKNRIWRKRIKYDCRKKLADSRPRVKGRFVKSLEPEEEQ